MQLDLHGASGGATGDAQTDSVVVNGTNADDAITVSGTPTDVLVSGLKANLKIVGAEAANHRLTVNALGGADPADASKLAANLIQLSLSGGAGDDVLLGSQGDDTILGNPGQ